MKILLLEDDYLYRISIKDFLHAHNYEVDDVENGCEALNLVYENRYTMLLLDIRVPGMDGYALLKQIREDGIMVPVILLTSLTDIEDLSLGYELGCSDYLRKPFELKELQCRIEHIIQQDIFRSKQKNIEIGKHHTFDVSKQILYQGTNKIELSGIETKLVSFLVQNKGFFVSIEILKENVWASKNITDADIRMCIKRARGKCDKSFIQTKRMVGYRIGD